MGFHVGRSRVCCHSSCRVTVRASPPFLCAAGLCSWTRRSGRALHLTVSCVWMAMCHCGTCAVMPAVAVASWVGRHCNGQHERHSHMDQECSSWCILPKVVRRKNWPVESESSTIRRLVTDKLLKMLANWSPVTRTRCLGLTHC